MPVEKTCIVCEKKFNVIPSRADKAKTCSKDCKYALAAQTYRKERVELSCKKCGSAFYVPKCHVSRRIYCSEDCANDSRSSSLSKYSKATGEGNHNWKSGTWAYRRVMLEDIKDKAPEHPFLVDGNLKKKLVVHHIDKDRSNNSIDNLLLLTAGAHARIHKQNRRPDPWECWPPNPESY